MEIVKLRRNKEMFFALLMMIGSTRQTMATIMAVDHKCLFPLYLPPFASHFVVFLSLPLHAIQQIIPRASFLHLLILAALLISLFTSSAQFYVEAVTSD